MKISAQSVTESGTGSRHVRRVFAARLDHQVVLVRREILQLPRLQLKADSLIICSPVTNYIGWGSEPCGGFCWSGESQSCYFLTRGPAYQLPAPISRIDSAPANSFQIGEEFPIAQDFVLVSAKNCKMACLAEGRWWCAAAQ